jgi:hypothetical protein
MSNYFTFFPEVRYDGKVVKDITRRTDLTERFIMSPEAFLPYTIEDGLRPEDVAYYYYGDVAYTWLIFAANDIIDPYYEWPMSYDDFYKTLGMKYRDTYFNEYSNTLTYSTKYEIPLDEVVQWTKNATVNNNIVEYRAYANSDLKINHDTYSVLYDPNVIQGDYYPVRIYDYELQENDNRREIFLVDRQFADRVVSEHRDNLK